MWALALASASRLRSGRSPNSTPREEGLHGVVVASRDGIELVIVTARTADAETEKRVPGRHNDLVQGILPGEALRLLILADLSRKKDCGGHQEAGGGVFSHRVAGQLFENELLIGTVFIESADDVVAVRPGVGALGVDFEAVGVGVANEIEPVLGPAFAVAGTGQQLVDQTGDCLVVLIG